MPQNKFQVYVVAYPQFSHVSDPHGPTKIHWAIWVEPKNNRPGYGRLFHVEDQHWLNEPGTSSDSNLTGRYMIGKLPVGSGYEALEQLLRGIARPTPGVRDPCIIWVRDAIRTLQGGGWAEPFDVDEFTQKAQRGLWHGLRGVIGTPAVIRRVMPTESFREGLGVWYF